MLMRRIFVLGATALLVAGCMTTAHTLSTSEVQSWKVASIETVVAPDASLVWPKVADPFMDKHLPPGPAETYVSDESGREMTRPGRRPPMTPEIQKAARAVMQTELDQRARRYMEPVRGALIGQRPVKVVTTVHRLDIPSTGRQIAQAVIGGLIGGVGAAQSQSTMTVSTDIVDAKTGAVLLSYPKSTMVLSGGENSWMMSNAGDPYSGDAAAALLKKHHDQYLPWLLKAS
jgi:hypothetical protein